jgi:hypothetical protein
MMLKERDISEEEILLLTKQTAGFSFAYLKELSLSGLMAWLRVRSKFSLADSMLEQVETLRAQMKSEPETKPFVEEADDDD